MADRLILYHRAYNSGVMTVEEFRRLPESDTHIVELHHGKVVRMTRPKKRHDDCTMRIHDALPVGARKRGVAAREFTFRPMPEHELRVADFAWVARERWQQTDPDDNLRGAPEFVVEVVSPSNTADELQERKQLCLATGCVEYWTVYPKLLQVEAATATGARVYKIGDIIESITVPGLRLPVRDVFLD
ncbi:MAG: Uma2 family endonuclease [Bryobacterales bacterium]|nr:Uma2 family endonuclease [Bryobacterales bacterium]